MMFKAKANEMHVKFVKETILDDTDFGYGFVKIMLMQIIFKYVVALTTRDMQYKNFHRESHLVTKGI